MNVLTGLTVVIIWLYVYQIFILYTLNIEKINDLQKACSVHSWI